MVTRTRRPTRITAATTAVALITATNACVVVLGMDRLSEGRHDASVDAGEESSVCEPDSIDAAPKPPPQSVAGSSARFFAVNQLNLALGSADGFDLDHRVTTLEDPASQSCTSSQPIADPSSGVDNAGATLFTQVAVLGKALSSDAINQRLREGAFGLILGIGGWNETSDDDEITVAIYPALGIWSYPSGGQRVPGGATVTPRLGIVGGGDASDEWMRDERFGPLGQSGVSKAAWIAKGKLVARFDSVTIPIRADYDAKLIDLTVHDAWLTADINAISDPRGVTLNSALFAGRLDVESFLGQLMVLQTGPSKYLCLEPQLPALARTTVCGYRDIRLSHCDDNRGLPCDGLSVAMRFDTYVVDPHGSSFGASFLQTDELYENLGSVPPTRRCLDAGLALRDGALPCE